MIIKRRGSNLVSNSFFNSNMRSEQEKNGKKRLSIISSVPSNTSKKEIHLFHRAKKDL